MRFSILTSLFLLCSHVIAQNTFSFFLESEYIKYPNEVVEEANGNLVALVTEYIGHDYAPGVELYRAGFLKFSPLGDTSTLYPVMGDTVFGFSSIVENNKGGYLIAGFSRLPDSDSLSLMFMEVDEQFIKMWTKHHYLPEIYDIFLSNIFPDSIGYYAFGYITYTISGSLRPIFIRLDNQGNIIRYHIYHDGTLDLYEYTFNPDRNRIWLFSKGGLDPINQASRAVFDTNFNHLYSEAIDPYEMRLMTLRWKDDSSFYLAFQCNRIDAQFQDDELCIGLYDTLMNPIHFKQFGEYDSFDYPAWVYPISFQNYDSIFYAGTIDVFIGYPPEQYTNYIMIGQTDEQLQERYRRYYGGDGYYDARYIKATSDGGCFLSVRKFNHTTEVYNVLFLKLDNEGELVYIVGSEAPLYRFRIYPNPATSQLHIETTLPQYTFVLSDMQTRVLYEGYSGDKKSMIDISRYPAGAYVISFAADGNNIETQKFIKY
jgi:hypothetical protein